MYIQGVGVCIKGRERDRWDLGKLLSYLTSMDVNLCFSASLSADLHKLFRAKRGLYSGSKVVSYGFWAYLSRASKFSLLLSSATRATSPCITESKAVASLKMVMQGLQTLLFGWTVLTG